MRLLEPVRGFVALALLRYNLSQFALEFGIRERGLQFLFGNSLQDEPRVAGAFPEVGIELTPEIVGRVIPCPTKIEGKFGQRAGDLSCVHVGRIRAGPHLHFRPGSATKW